jgi:hypothetical protein
MPFTPNNSEQRLPPTCYRGCWHVVSRGLFAGSCHPTGISSHGYSSPAKGFYNLSAFLIHAASLRQTFVHCGIFLAAASRRSLGRISVPMWPFTLSGRLLIIALVGHYPANKLISRRLISGRPKRAFPDGASTPPTYSVLSCVSTGYPHPQGRSPTCYSPVRRSMGDCSPLPLDLHA